MSVRFLIERSIPRDMLNTLAPRIFQTDISQIGVIERAGDESADADKAHWVVQKPSSAPFYTYLILSGEPSAREAARLIATEGGVEVLWFDEENAEWDDDDVYAPSPGPYYFFRPDGTVREARLDVAKAEVPVGKKLPSVEERFIFLD